MVITPSGMVMLVRDVQQESAPSPIDVTLLGIMMLVRDDHWNALSSMDVTPSGMMILTDLPLERTVSDGGYGMPIPRNRNGQL